jgi:hypothetical protein
MCHVDGPDKNVKQLASFEQSCATCHEQQIQQSAESGIAIFALPSIDTEAIEAQQLNVGTWPLVATGDFDGKFPPAMKLLLYADADAAEALDRFEARYGANFDFADVDGEDADQVADAVELVWASKRLLNEMALSGRAAIASRLTRALASDVSAEQVARLAAELDESVFQNTVRRWLPGLAAEVASRKFDGISRPTQLIASSRDASASGRFKPVKFTRAVQADEVLADNPLMDLLGGVSATRDETVESTRPVVRKAQSIAVDRLKDHGTGRKPAKKQLKLKNRLADEVVSDKLLLAVNPLSTLGEGRVIEADQLPPMDSGDPASSEVTVGSEVNAIAGRGMTQPPAISRVGWYRDDEMFRVFYRPGGHEDDGLRAWSDLIASAAASNDRPETAALFHQLLSDKGIGLCATCHTVDQQSDQSFLVNWTTKYRHPSDRSFTKFSHQPHTLQPHLRDCSGCHDMSQPISNADSFAGFDPLNAVSNFAPITKMNCVSCHREGHTDNGCTHCHRYHVGE